VRALEVCVRVSECFGSNILLSRGDDTSFLLLFARKYVQCNNICLIRDRFLGYLSVAMGQVFSEYFGFPCQFSFHTHHHLSFGAGTIGLTVADVPS
jgi:hypothetical protein